ncbi:hypothetical protein CP533_0541 [Ophiocordyceps camponoti-saundersi (nom. inval.)]|nr:hypothetical protein CP533_0541 [Ophiocordyceps camponoti-saundersi (nom. inval.)]
MNWTSGSLARHARGRSWKEDEARQKQHFARVRALAQGKSRTQPPPPPPSPPPPPPPPPSLPPPPTREAAAAAAAVAVDAVDGVPRDDAGPPPPRRPHQPPSSFQTRKAKLLERPDWAGLGKKTQQSKCHRRSMMKRMEKQASVSETGTLSPTGSDRGRRRIRLARLAALADDGMTTVMAQPRPSRAFDRPAVLDAEDMF